MADNAAYGRRLYDALQSRQVVVPLIEQAPALNINDAYAISLAFLDHRLAAGERVVGKKIGVTSKAVQDMLGVHQPDFGFLTNAMHVSGDIDIDAHRLIAPRAEAEIGFILAADLNGPGITPQDVIAATAAICPCFEIVDSRVRDWKISIIDTVADNASCGVFVLGTERLDPQLFKLPDLRVSVSKNGEPLSEGYGRAVQGDPAMAVAWLANTLGSYGVSLNAGDIILSGSLVPLEPAARGDKFAMQLWDGDKQIGACAANFI